MESEQGAEELWRAITEGDATEVDRLIASGISPSARVGRGMISPLGYAVQLGHLEISQHLIEAGADPNWGGRKGRFPLYVAAKVCNTELIQLLLENGANLNYQYMNGNTALMEAVKLEDCTIVNILMDAGADITITNNGGESVLHLAAASGNDTLVKKFLDAGIPADQTVKNWRLVKHLAGTGLTALHLAAYGPSGGHPIIAKILLDNGANINAAMSNGRTALSVAAIKNATKVAAILIQRGCDLNPISMENEEHKTPLMHAVDAGHKDMVEKLVLVGADMSIPDLWGIPPLTAAIFTGKPHLAQILIEAGCNVNQKGRNGLSPLQASYRNNPYVTKILLLAGAIFDPLHISCFDDVDKNNSLGIVPTSDHLGVLLQHIPLSLQQICRINIRAQLLPFPQSKTAELPVPPRINNYLNFGDFDDI